MTGSETLLKPEQCALLLVDFQAGLAFGVESFARQTLLNNAVALARTAIAFKVPVVASTSASRVYSGPMLPALQEALPSVTPVERRNMNVWEDDVAHRAVMDTGRKRLIVAGLLTEACVSFPVLSALNDGFEVFVVADACGGLSPAGHDLALRRMESAGAQLTSWIQVLLEFQRDWTRHETYEDARSIVVANGGGYGMGLAYAREMIHPA
ncbi:hydrolase [Terracidiphilus gabretensis]|jgi:nicotinamidase-related amidase|uniref:hydrolase n=1 Tax=Terracidiphilus gabretensis TaxID=1577687 RepID=UPI00071B0E3B|nr:hydrolase [Terracidiphilus gabretensis]